MSVNVLIVDDSATMRRMIRKVLDMSGLDFGEVYEAENGIDALARLAEHEIGCVLMDINMPVMNGVQFLTRLQVDPRLRGIPVIIASTEGSETRIAALLQTGARGFVRKPFQPQQLRDVLAPLLGLRAAEAQAGAVSQPDDTSF